MQRRFIAGTATVAALGLLALGTGTAWAGPGQHPTPADCAAPPAGTACLVATGTSDHAGTPILVGDTVNYTFTLTNSGDTDGGAPDVALHLGDDLDYVNGSAKVNGAAVSVTRPGGIPDIADPFLVPAHGSATVTFSATVLSPFTGVPTAQATYIEVGGVQTSNDVVVSPPAIDLTLTPSTGNGSFTADPVRGGTLDLVLADVGTTQQASTVSVPAPAGWTITGGDAASLGVVCHTTGSSRICDVPAFPQSEGRDLQFTVTPGASVPVGAVGAIAAVVTPTGGADEVPADNTFTFHATNAGAAKLSVAISSDRTTVLKNGLVTFTVRLTNEGPNPSTNPAMALSVDTKTANGFTQLQPHGPGQIAQGSGSAPIAGPTWNWAPGTLAVGQTVSLTLQWRANVLGAAGALETDTFEDPYNANINIGSVQRVVSAAVTVVSPPPSGPGASAASGGSGLAATGASATAPIGWGLGLVLAGGALIGLTRRRAIR